MPCVTILTFLAIQLVDRGAKALEQFFKNFAVAALI